MKKRTKTNVGRAAELGRRYGVRNDITRTHRSAHSDHSRIGDIEKGEAKPIGKLLDKSHLTVGWIYQWSSGELSFLWLQGRNGMVCIEWLPDR